MPLDIKLPNRGRKMKTEFFKTQTQFPRSNFDGQHSPGGKRPFDFLDNKRNEKENKILTPKGHLDLKFKDEGMHLIEKYADRFQLNVDECKFSFSCHRN